MISLKTKIKLPKNTFLKITVRNSHATFVVSTAGNEHFRTLMANGGDTRIIHLNVADVVPFKNSIITNTQPLREILNMSPAQLEQHDINPQGLEFIERYVLGSDTLVSGLDLIISSLG